MRAKLSTTADGTYRGFAPPTRPASDFFSRDTNVGEPAQAQPAPHTSGQTSRYGLQRAARSTQALSADIRGEGLLHDARNMVSAIGLYCDLLSMPGVLKPEHRQYPEELRLLGTRSRVLIEHLLRSLVSQNLFNQDQESSSIECTVSQAYPSSSTDRRVHGGQPTTHTLQPPARANPVSLRTTVERCSGLLSRLANGRPVEVIYGAAADLPVSISEEAIDRILVNLVRNASQALDRQEPLASPDDAEADADTDQHPLHAGLLSTDLPHRQHRRPAASVLPGSCTPIRISVGPLLERIGEARSWPFQHVRLVVEDSGCGMEPKQLHSLLSERMSASRGIHGIGFRVVRELVAASNGDLRAASTPGIGTRVQIEWPVAATPTAEKDRALMQRKSELRSTLKSTAIERHHPLIPAASQPSTIAGSQGTH